MTALDFIITTYHNVVRDMGELLDADSIVDVVEWHCEENGVDFHKVGRAAFGGRS